MAKQKVVSNDGNHVVIEMKNKVIVLKLLDFDSDVDVDELLKIDYSNIVGELLTFPVLFNRIANFKAELENIVAVAKLDVEVFEAQLYEEYKKKMLAAGDKATDKGILSATLMDARYSAKKKDFFARQKDLAYIDSLYWSAKSKDGKLDRMSDKLRPEEFEKEIMEGIVNGIMIKSTKKTI